MITIITGVPGMGKSALIVSMMLEEQKKGWEGGERPFFVMGVPELTLDHSRVPPVSEWTEQRPDPDDPSLMLDYFTFPPNSIVVIDEAQKVYRPRAAASKVPPHVAAFETHRHTGVDFWLLTQKPHLLDSNVRELCGRHIHIKNALLGRWLYEWPEFTDVKSKANFADAAKRKFSPPKKAFSYYKSAQLHTTQPRRFHQVYLVLLAGLTAVGYFGYKTYNNIFSKIDTQAIQAQAEKKPSSILPSLPAPTAQTVQPAEPAPPKLQQAALQELQTPIIHHPFSDYTFTIKGVMQARGQDLAYFDLTNANGQKTFVSSLDLIEMGYAVRIVNGCTAVLYYNGLEILAACSQDAQQPALSPSAVVAAADVKS